MESIPIEVRKPFARRGFSPLRLLAQVENTAAWALGGSSPWGDFAERARALEVSWQSAEAREAYFELMLSAHFLTVATLVPTDLDSHIRHHIWRECRSADDIERLLQPLLRVASWSPRAVSERVVAVHDIGDIYGHRGEWHSVMAGGLAIALQLDAQDTVAQIAAHLDAVVELEALAFAKVRAQDDFVLTLKVATTLAHNDGDLSRVVEAWPQATPRRAEYVEKYCRLGHRDDRVNVSQREHFLAGQLNKAVMADENHRHLPLREAKGLRGSRDLLVPFAPFLGEWGEKVARATALDARDVGAVVAALLAGHEHYPELQGYMRALAGIHRTYQGGIEALSPYVSAAQRKLLAKGKVRDAIRLPEAHFLERVRKQYERAVAGW